MTCETLLKMKAFVGAFFLMAGIPCIYAEENIAVHAYHLRMDGKVDDAKKVLEQTLAKDPNNAGAWLELARLEFQRGGKTAEMDSAQKAIESAIRVAPQTPLHYRWAARIAIYNGILKKKNRADVIEQFRKGVSAAEKALTLDPADHQARRMLVSLYGNNPPELGGDAELAEKHVKALESRSAMEGAAARCEFSFKNQPEKKLAHWNDLAQTHGDNSILHENIALLHAWMGDVEQASVHAKKALALDPKRGRVLIDLARALALQKQLAPAEKFAQEYLDFVPPVPLALRAWTYMALGRIADMKGNKSAAQESLKKAKELDPYCWFTMTPPPEELFEAP